MKRAAWIWSLFFLLRAACVWGGTGLFVEKAVRSDQLDLSYQTDITMIQGYPPTSATLTSIERGNWGASTRIRIGRNNTGLNRNLLAFPLASLAGKYSRLLRARLVLSLVSPPLLSLNYTSFPTPQELSLFRISSANAGWKEGTVNNGLECAGAACWGFRSTPGTDWAGARGCGAAGSDILSQPAAATSLTSATWSDGRKIVFELNDVSFLDDWIRHPELNAGFLLRSTTIETLPASDRVQIMIYSDDAPNPLLRPRFEVDYEALPAEPLATASFGAAPSSLCVGIAPVAGAAQISKAACVFNISALKKYAHAVRSMRLTLTVQETRNSGGALDQFHQLQLGLPISGAPALASRVLVPAELRPGDPISFDITETGFVHNWIDNPASNTGFLLASPTLEEFGKTAPNATGQIIFYSSGAAQTAFRPRLDVIYATSLNRSRTNPAWLKVR